MFSTTVSSKGVGCLKSRSDQKLFNTDQEKTLFAHTPAHDFYTKLGRQALQERVTFDIYLGVQSASESIDLASLNQVVQMTGGDLNYYPKFNAPKHAEKMYY